MLAEAGDVHSRSEGAALTGEREDRLASEARLLFLVRALVVVASLAWLAMEPQPRLVVATVAAFTAYGIGLLGILWRWPERTMGWSLAVLGVDLAFALLVIDLTGGARSEFFLTLPVIAALQAYHYGTRRGLAAAGLAGLLYLAVCWPTLGSVALATHALRLGLLLAVAGGLGAIGRREREEREAVLALNQALDSRERLVRDIAGSLRDGLVVLDRDGRVAEWNRAMATHSGIAAGAALGRRLSDVLWVPGGDRLQAVAESVQGGLPPPITPERFCHRPAGRAQDVVLEVRGSAIRAADGTPAGVILLVEDVTARVALEASLRQAERLAGIGTLAAGVAHEINNPLGVIMSRTELILDDAAREGLGSGVRDDLRVIRVHAHRIARVTQSLGVFALRRAVEREPVHLNRLVLDTVRAVAATPEGAAVVLRTALAPETPEVEGDPVLLGQAVMQLVLNACEAAGPGGAVLVRTEIAPGPPAQARLVVQDSGAGIPAEVAPRIFEPFFTTRPDRTGLGLAVCYGIVREHGGAIAVESAPGEGAAFVLTLPARENERRETEPAERTR